MQFKLIDKCTHNCLKLRLDEVYETLKKKEASLKDNMKTGAKYAEARIKNIVKGAEVN